MSKYTESKRNDFKRDSSRKLKYKTEVCKNDMTFQDCELAILRHAVDETQELYKAKVANSDEVLKMIDILETFLIEKKLICYGGTAINNILPKSAQFYNRDVEIPDYDFYSPHALADAKELADIYHKAGYQEVEAKSGMHVGTFKVFVNFIPIADITEIPKSLFRSIQKEAVSVAGIRYSPPNLLRMNMYLELSRPAGDVSRWEKVLKRLTLLNEYYPLDPKLDCAAVDFQRKMESHSKDSEKIYLIIRDSFIDQGVVFFGGFASSLYAKYMPKVNRKLIQKIPDFDVLSDEPEKCALIVSERLKEEGFKEVRMIKHAAVGEIIPKHIEIRVGLESLAFIYEPIACHNFNIMEMGGKEIRVATIDTILSFYFAFYYSNNAYYYRDRILCMAKFLFELEQKNRLSQDGLLKRFSIQCYGKQPSVEDIRAEKAKKYKELKGDEKNPEYEMWFLKYNPANKTKRVYLLQSKNMKCTRKRPYYK
jgi:hypothetical protein